METSTFNLDPLKWHTNEMGHFNFWTGEIIWKPGHGLLPKVANRLRKHLDHAIQTECFDSSHFDRSTCKLAK